MKKLIKQILSNLFFAYIFAKALIIKFIFSEKAWFIVGTPLHSNIGDQAIAYSEFLFIKKYCRDIKLIEVPSQFYMRYQSIWDNLIGDSNIFIHGGGFIGALWPEEDKMIRTVIDNHISNKIVVFPQSITFYDDSLIDDYRKRLDSCQNIKLCLREEYSYLLAKEYGFSNIYLIPDMVTLLSKNDFGLNKVSNSKRDKILLCLRNDCEKSIDDDCIFQILNEKSINNYQVTDMHVNHAVLPILRKAVVKYKLIQFEKAQLVITDRLHGMVISAISGTPCIVLKNCNHKISGVYNWLKDKNPNVVFIERVEDLKDILDINKNISEYDNSNLLQYFEELKSLIEE